MINRRHYLSGMGALAAVSACAPVSQKSVAENSALEAYHPSFSDFISPSEKWDILSTGHQWLEGPAWDTKRQKLYFTDVPLNVAYSWSEADGVEQFLKPSGADLSAKDGFREPGSNGLLYEAESDSLLMCNHGERSLQRIKLQTKERTNLVSTFKGKKFNSPNDVVKSKNGTLFFTDPPYGLTGLNASPLKEVSSNGVYKLTSDGEISVVVSDMSFPNGISLSPDDRYLYIAQSDPKSPIVRRVSLDSNLEPMENQIWLDLSSYLDDANPGLPDGMAMCRSGEIFITGPGGVFLVSPEGNVFGRIRTGRATANCAFGEDGKTLFITSGHSLLKIRTQCTGLNW